MYRCTRPGCRWQAIAPTEQAAREQYVDHLLDEHVTEVEADIPEGMVQIKLGADEEWRTVTPEEAHQLHQDHHGDED